MVCLALGLVLWHCCHRTFHALHDLKLHPPEIVRSLVYGVALLTPAIGYSLCLARMTGLHWSRHGSRHLQLLAALSGPLASPTHR